MQHTTKNSRLIGASADTVYQAFTNTAALEVWLAPGDMKGKIHSFDFREGGWYEMSLFYPDHEKEMTGKTAGNEDRFKARFVEIISNKKIVQAVNFESSNPDFSEEMIMEVTFEPKDGGTNVTFFFKDIPKGIKPEDNVAGTILTLEKLARYVE